MRRTAVTLLAVAAVVAAMAVVFVGEASAGAFGVAVLKDCTTPMNVGDPYSCEVELDNQSQSSHASVRVTSLTDVVLTSPSQSQTFPINSSSFSSLGGMIRTGGATCDATGCTVPFGGTLTTPFFSHYAAQVADFPTLSDQATYTWNEICSTSQVSGCNGNANHNQATASADINPVPTTTTTSINSGGVGGVTAVAAGSSVTDSVTVANNIQNQPPPTGSVTVNFYGTFNCSGNPLDAPSQNALDGNGQALNVHPEGPLAAGLYSYQAVYPGSPDGAYTGSTGACEPLRVVDANISISPNGVNRVGFPHTFTAHVNVNDGTGSAPAPDGTPVSFSLSNTLGALASFVGPSTCTTTGGACQVTISSPTTGVTTASASTTLSVDGVSLTRSTNGSGGNSGPATKTWVDARILIAPNATNEVGHPHTFTVTLLKDIGNGGGFQPAPGETVTVTLTPSNGANPSPAGPFTLTTDANGQVHVTFSSPTAGQVLGSASSTLSVAGSAPFTVQTDGTNGSSGPATKTFVDANIQLTPTTATNEVGHAHVFTAHVNVNSGSGFAPAPAGTLIDFQILSGPGSLSAPSCLTVGSTGECSVTLNSATAGVTVLNATTDVSVGGLVLHRSTGDALAGDSPNATKTWVDANIQISPQTATNPVGTQHVLTITVNAIGGTIDAAGGTATASIVSGPGSFVGSPTCTYAGGGASASCTVTITSNTAGTTVVQATSNIPVSGLSITRTTGSNAGPGGSGNAQKTWLAGDANIQITPGNASNAVGTTHTLHCHVNVSPDSTTYSNAPDGTVCTVTITSGPGTPTTQNCTTTGGTGTCDVTITSSTPGTSTINASTTVVVNGVSLTRTTNGSAGNSGPATKNWVDAYISITPATATNPTGTNHVLTITVHAYPAGTNLASGTATASILAGSVGSFVGGNSCNYTGGSDTASCTVTITSSATGTTTVRATSNISFQAAAGSVTRTTGDGYIVPGSSPAVGDSADAVKHWVDANISITPSTANNPIGSNHVLTITVNALGGTIDAGPHTATATIVSGPGSFVGSPACTYSGGAATASCQVTITSATTGTTVVSATSNIPVNGQTITRTTGTAANTASGGSGNASKNWGDVTNVTHVRDAANNDITGTSVTGGTVVHDEATVTRTAGTPAAVPNPTGTVTFNLYATGDCTGQVQTLQVVNVTSNGVETSSNFTTPVANGSFSYLAVYSGDANYPSKTATCEPFTVIGTPPGQIAPTQTTCSQYTGGTSSTLGSINYSVQNGKIGQNINPGVFFYFAEIKTTTANQVVTVGQTNNSTNNAALFQIRSASLLTASCGALSNGTLNGTSTGASFTVATPGTYVIQIKYDSKSIAGTTAPIPANITYSFTTSLGGNTGASVQLVKQ